jgi:hypothetical protein
MSKGENVACSDRFLALPRSKDSKHFFFLRGNSKLADKAKISPSILSGQITRAPPWCFLSKIQSFLPTRLRPPITNMPKVELPMSIQWTPAPQCCLPGNFSSLLAPSPPQYCAACCKEERVPGGN